MTDPGIILIIAATFLLAGAVKGVIGLGLPTVSLGILTAALDLPTAMALLIVPSFVTNAFQASVGGNARVILARIWPFLLMATATVWLGASALTRVDLDLLSILLGFLLISYATINLAGLRLVISARNEAWAGPAFGVANGVLTGMTGSFVVPGVMFLQAIGLSRDMLIQAMGMLFTASTVALALAHAGSDRHGRGAGRPKVPFGGAISAGVLHLHSAAWGVHRSQCDCLTSGSPARRGDRPQTRNPAAGAVPSPAPAALMDRSYQSHATQPLPFAVRKRGRAEACDTLEGWTERTRPRADSALVNALARGYLWQRMLEGGQCRARRGREDRTVVFLPLLRLTLLSPAMVEEVPDGRCAAG